MDDAHSPDPVDLQRAAEVYAALLPQLDALPTEAVDRGTLNLTRAALNALAAVPHLRAARAQMQAELPSVPADLPERLEGIAFAAFHANLLSDPSEDALFADIAPDAYKLRKGLVGVLAGLIERERIPADSLEDVIPGKGYEDLATDLGKVAVIFRTHWGALLGRVDVELAEITEAERLSTLIITRLASRRSAPLAKLTTEPTVADRRARAATLLRQIHDDARRAGSWLFWRDPDGWEKKVPSLSAGTGGRPRTRDVPPEPMPEKPPVE